MYSAMFIIVFKRYTYKMLHDVLASMYVWPYNFLCNNLIVAMNKYKIQLKTMQIYKFAWQPFLTASSYIEPKYVSM
jgi:hypothetical protein